MNFYGPQKTVVQSFISNVAFVLCGTLASKMKSILKCRTLSVCLFVCQFVCSNVCPSFCLSVCLFERPVSSTLLLEQLCYCSPTRRASKGPRRGPFCELEESADFDLGNFTNFLFFCKIFKK